TCEDWKIYDLHDFYFVTNVKIDKSNFSNKILSKEKYYFCSFVIGHEQEIDLCMKILLKKNKNNPILIGENKTGKTTLLNELAKRIVCQNFPVHLSKHLIPLNIKSLIGISNNHHEFEEHFKLILTEINNSHDDPILLSNDIDQVIDGENIGTINISNLLQKILGEFQCIATTTLDKYK
ncbi:unnamed protein product, partial [Rotaria sp. Silwood2]